MRRITCGGCQSSNLDLILDLGLSPLADDFPHSREEAAAQPKHPLQLLRCNMCTLIQLGVVISDDILWGGDYGFYTGSSWVAVQQQHAYADDLMQRYPQQAQGLVVEIACNDGSMLQRFARQGHQTLGVDPAAGPVAKAREAGLQVIHAGFGTRTALDIGEGAATLVVANNVIAHVADLDDFVAGLAYILDPYDGVAVVEFQYVADLLLGNQFDHVYDEHRSFFSLTSLTAALARHNLHPMSVQQTTPQGGSLRVHIGHRVTPDASVLDLAEQERWLSHAESAAGLQGRAERIRDQLLHLLHQLSSDGKLIAGFGASAKSTTLLNFCGITSDLVPYFVDTTPTKHGRFTPGTGIPIISPESDSRAPDVYLVGVRNYLPQIMRKEKTFTGQWLSPIPVPTLF